MIFQDENLVFIGLCIICNSSFNSNITKSLNNCIISDFEKKLVNNPFLPGVTNLKARLSFFEVSKLAYLFDITEKNRPLSVNE